MNEIKEILHKNIQFNVNLERADDPTGDNVDEEGLIKALESYISSHYIAKEKVRGLKLEKMKQTKEESDTDWFYGYGYNEAVSEINKAVDDLVEDNK